MQFLKNLFAKIKLIWTARGLKEVSIVVDELAESMQMFPEAFEMTMQGGELFIRAQDNAFAQSHFAGASIRLEPTTMTLQMPNFDRVELSATDKVVLMGAVRTWLKGVV